MPLYEDYPAGQAVSDAVHGQVQVSDLEKAIIDDPFFQRLRNIRQLGLVSFVYPSADYSRFSHSLGTMNVMGNLLISLRSRYDELISETVVKVYRVIALLHDVGHYPLSHLYEDAVQRHTGCNREQIFNHEKAGAHIIETRFRSVLDGSQLNRDLSAELKRFHLEEVSLTEITSMVIRSEASILRFGIFGTLAKLLRGSIDCDRLDFLLRTSRVSGLPYGGVDLNYIGMNIRLGQEPRKLFFARKAELAAMHMLESRVYDYLTTSYHRTVKGFELELIDGMSKSMETKHLPSAEQDIQEFVSSGKWLTFDDGGLRSMLGASDDPNVRLTADRVFSRRVRKTLYSRTFELSKASLTDLSGYKTFKVRLQQELEAAEKGGVPKGGWYVQAMETLDASDADLFEEAENLTMKAWQDRQKFPIRPQLARLRDSVTLVVHYYLDPESDVPWNYKDGYEETIEKILLGCIDRAITDVKKENIQSQQAAVNA